MFHFMPDVWSSKIIVESLRVIFYLYLLFSSTFVFALNELFLKLVSRKWLDKWIEFLLLIVPSWSSRINKYLGTYYSSENFRLFNLCLLNVDNNQEMKVLPFIIVSRGGKFHCTKVNLPIYHLHFTFTSNSNIKKCNLFRPFILPILFYCEYLSLH